MTISTAYLDAMSGNKVLVPFSFRFGHATNSSSSHSIVLVPRGTKDRLVNKYFGWQPFVAASPEAKRKYILAQVFEGLGRVVKDRELRAILSSALCGARLEDAYQLVNEPRLDHQSVLAIPEDGKSLKEWISELTEFLLRPDVAVVGGNDSEPCDPRSVVPGCRVCDLKVPFDGCGRLVLRRDPEFGFWVAYDPWSGNRIRFRWSEDPVPDRGSIPELVEMKITDFCPRECSFCYQGSSEEGSHAQLDDVFQLLSSLKSLNVFEVVLGGGEPTLHPHFLDILEQASDTDLEVSFTTRDLDWMEKFGKEVNDLVNAIGISCSSGGDVVSAYENAVRHDLDLDKLVIHLIPDLDGRKALGALDACFVLGLRPLLLGLKPVGRAEKLDPALPDGFFDKIRGHFVSVDTVFASRYRDELEAAQVRRDLYDVGDHPWGCYIDAVRREIGPNSYTPGRMLPLETLSEDCILACFRKTSCL